MDSSDNKTEETNITSVEEDIMNIYEYVAGRVNITIAIVISINNLTLNRILYS